MADVIKLEHFDCKTANIAFYTFQQPGKRHALMIRLRPVATAECRAVVVVRTDNTTEAVKFCQELAEVSWTAQKLRLLRSAIADAFPCRNTVGYEAQIREFFIEGANQ